MDNQMSQRPCSGITIQALPPELLSKIFILASPDVMLIAPGRRDCQWALSSVCHGWRRIALQTPELWSSICINMGKALIFPVLFKLFDMQKRCITRAGSRPLSFYYTEKDQIPVGETSNLCIALFVLPFVSQLSTIALFGGPATLHAFLSFPPHSMPLLEEVHMSEWDEDPDDSPPIWADECTALESCAKLTKFTLTAASIETDILSFRLPWRQITVLDLSHGLCHVHHLHSILQNCDKLQTCQLGIALDLDIFPDSPLPAQPTTTHVHLPFLHTLSLFADTNEAPEQFLTRLDAPHLKDFCLTMVTDPGWEPESYLDLARRSALHSLKLSIKMTPAMLIDVLKATPSLRTLDVPFGSVKGDVMPCIASGEFTPQLETLLQHYRNFDDTDKALLVTAFLGELACIPNWTGKALKKVVINRIENFTAEQTASIARLVAGGLEFVFKRDSDEA